MIPRCFNFASNAAGSGILMAIKDQVAQTVEQIGQKRKRSEEQLREESEGKGRPHVSYGPNIRLILRCFEQIGIDSISIICPLPQFASRWI